jgi:hypothetical protein
MTDIPKRHIIPEPYPETIGVAAMTIWVPKDFRGDAEIIWYPGKIADTDKQWMTCSTFWLLQGIFHDVRGSRFSGRLNPGACFQARVIALVVQKFYLVRNEAASRLEAEYQWRPY